MTANTMHLPSINTRHSQQAQSVSAIQMRAQPTDKGRLVESQNSIFDPAAMKNNSSAVSGTDERSSNVINQLGKMHSLIGCGSVTLPKEQTATTVHPFQELEAPPEPKPQTLREILDGLDSHEPNIEFLNQNPWIAPTGKNSNDEVRLYEQFCVRGGVTASHLRVTQDYENGKTTKQLATVQSKPSINQKVLQTYKQDNQGVLESRETSK